MATEVGPIKEVPKEPDKPETSKEALNIEKKEDDIETDSKNLSQPKQPFKPIIEKPLKSHETRNEKDVIITEQEESPYQSVKSQPTGV